MVCWSNNVISTSKEVHCKRLIFTDYLYLLSIFLVGFMSVDPFHLRLIQVPLIKNLSFIMVLPALVLSYASVLLHRKETHHLLNDNYKLAYIIFFFFVYVFFGSLWGRFVEGTVNGFLNLGLYSFTFFMTLWFLSQTGDPFKIIKLTFYIFLFWIVVSLVNQVYFWGDTFYFHSREFLVIGFSALFYFISKTNLQRALSILLLVVMGLLSQKNTGYLVLIMILAYIFILFFITRLYVIKSPFSKITLWFFSVLGFILFILVLAGFYIQNKSDLPTGNTDYRLHMYEIAFNKFLESPVYGSFFSGTATIEFDLFKVAADTQTLPTHSDFIDILAHGGIIGITLWILIYLIIFRKFVSFIRVINTSSSTKLDPYIHVLFLVCFSNLIVSSFNPVMNSTDLSWSFWSSLAMLISLLALRERYV